MFAWLKTNGGREIAIIVIIIVLYDNKHRLSLSCYKVHRWIKHVGVQLTTIRGRKWLFKIFRFRFSCSLLLLPRLCHLKSR